MKGVVLEIGWQVIGVLQRAAADIVRPFTEKRGFEVFVRWLIRGARERVPSLRLVFLRRCDHPSRTSPSET
jgi:hypothetical protein